MEIKADPARIADIISQSDAAWAATNAIERRVREAHDNLRGAQSELDRHEGNSFVPERRLIAMRDAVEIAQRNLQAVLAEQKRAAPTHAAAKRVGQAVQALLNIRT